MEWKAAPGAAKTVSNIALETYRRATAPIPFRVLWVAKDSIQILERNVVYCFIKDYLEGDTTRIALAVVVVLLLMPLDDKPSIGCLTDERHNRHSLL